jgi:hypothetical protein
MHESLSNPEDGPRTAARQFDLVVNGELGWQSGEDVQCPFFARGPADFYTIAREFCNQDARDPDDDPDQDASGKECSCHESGRDTVNA